MRRKINLLQLWSLCLPTGRPAVACSTAWLSKKHFMFQPKGLNVVNIYDISSDVVGFTKRPAGRLIEADSNLGIYLQELIV